MQETRKPSHLELNAFDYFSDRQFHLDLLERDPQVPYPLHSHDFHELVIVVGGSGIHFTDSAEYRILPGDVYVIEAGFSHGYADPEGLHLYNIIFDHELLSKALIDIKQMPGYHAIFNIEPKYRSSHRFESRLRLSTEDLIPITSKLEQLGKELSQEHGAEGSRAMALAYFIELIVRLSRLYTKNDHRDSGTVARLADAFSYIEHHLDRNISIEELMGITNMSSSTLNRAFHKAAGCSPVEYQIRLRIERACRLLRRTGHSMTMIADLTGFSDSNYFSRQFKRIMHCSPREYRLSTR